MNNRFGFKHIKLEPLPVKIIQNDELLEQIHANAEEKRFVQLGDYRQHGHLRLAMPIVRQSRDADVPSERTFAWFALQPGFFTQRKLLTLYGYARVRNVEGISDALKEVSTDDLGDFDVGKVLSKNEVLQLLETHQL